ncbi:hypothetical protein MNV49_007339 [Pseudohyphozyma bogoriensis]|nr:hypothetical protein MNV49_007339 [Pseudohyphozyma bogoriensis]
MSAPFLQFVHDRRTIYAIGDNIPISQEKVVEIVNSAIKDTPSAFNSQSGRALVLFGDEHKKIWEFAKKAIKAIVPESEYPASETRLNGFAAGAGTVVIFEDKEVVEGLQAAMPTYAAKFPEFSAHSSGMLAFVLWTALSAEGLGCSLQHYSPLIDADVQKEWGISPKWEITAQLVFGEKKAEAGDKIFKPVEERVKVVGIKA